MTIQDRDRAERRLVARSGVFDPTWYSARLPEDERSSDPLGHFLAVGWRAGLDPGPRFDTSHYLAQVPHVAAAGVNPLVHYLGGGWRFGLSPSPGFRAPPESALVPDACPLVLALALERPDEAMVGRELSGARWPVVVDPATDPAPEPPSRPAVTVVAFYLPQFHAIPENDRWWGAGFTEWTNVRRGRPRFLGHYQPHVPGDLGYYDLVRDPDIMRRQVDLARRHGVGAFCFYTYWFGGQKLLDAPVERWLNDPSLDLPYCLCWANENWTRTWDGKSREVLISQRHSPEDDIGFISDAARHLRDPRYLRVGGRPLLVVYRPGELPDPGATATRWRQWCRDNGIGEICLAYVQSFDTDPPEEFGFDFAIEFPPNNMANREAAVPGAEEFSGQALDWDWMARRALRETDYPRWPGVNPGWDNEARRPARGTVLVGSDPTAYRRWVERAARAAIERFGRRDERLIWVNAWNEWAEGAHLEPDRREGYRWLNATRSAVESASGVDSGTGPGVVVVTHDLQRNGAQLGSIALAGALASLGRRVRIVSCGNGPLMSAARRAAPLAVIDDDDAVATDRLARSLVDRGFTTVLANSSVTGRFAAAMKRAGAHVVGLVHELPGVLAVEARAERAAELAATADQLVFPDAMVRDRFPFEPGPGTGSRILAQGRYQQRMRLPDEDSRHRLRRLLNLPDNVRIVLAVGYGDHRKGIDLLLGAMAELESDSAGAPVHLVWVGDVDTADDRIVAARTRAPESRVHFPGFQADPSPYYRGADVLALPSREDPFPSVTLEALDAGLPVAAFRDATGQNELVAESGGVLIGEVTDHALAAGLRTALDDREPAARQLRRDLVAHRFNYRRYVLDLLSGTPAGIPRVSVVIPNYNYGKLIGSRIRQVLEQAYPVYELIVLDDASTDDSSEQIRRAIGDTDIAVLVIENESNSGSVYRQWQRGIAACRGDLVWIAEADDVADPGFLAEVVPPMRDEDVVLSYCESRQIDDDGNELAPDYRAWTDLGTRDYTRRYLRDGAEEIRDCLAVKNTIPNASAVVMRLRQLREVLARSGTEIADQHPTTGDWAIYLGLLGSGRISFSPMALNAHRRHGSSVIAREDRARHVREIERIHQRVAQAAADPGLLRRQADFIAALTRDG